MSVAIGGSAERLDIGGTLQDVLNVLTGRLSGPFVLLALVLTGAPAALIDLGNVLAKTNPVFALSGILGLIASFVMRPIFFGAVVFGATRQLDGDPVSIEQCFAAGRRRWGSMLGLMITTGMLTGLGLLLFVVPGIIIALMWAVAGPVLVLSNRGIAASRQESARLTKGRRWAMLLLYVVVVIALILVIGVLSMIAGALSLVAPNFIIAPVLGALINVCVDLPLSVLGAVLYRRLRADADGAPTAALAEVFA